MAYPTWRCLPWILPVSLATLLLLGSPALAGPAQEASSEPAQSTAQASAGAAADADPVPAGETQERTGLGSLGRDVLDDFRHLPSKRTLMWLGIAGGLGLAGHGLDHTFTGDPPYDEWGTEVFDAGAIIGNGLVMGGATTLAYGIGRWTGRPRLQHVARDMIRAQLVTQGIVHTIKPIVRRDRPQAAGTYSFPSGHAASTFATATVMARHMGRKTGIITYAVASYVAISRMHENEHFLSDCLFGSALGVAVGLTVTRDGRPSWEVVPTVSRSGAGILVAKVSEN